MRRLLVFLILCAPCLATTWPGQVGNSVGYQAYGSGTLNATACGAQSSGSSWATAVTISSCTYSTTSHTTISCSWCIFSQVDFKSSATADNNVLISGQHILFIGSRFQSNCIQCGNVSVTSTATDVYFLYDSFTPLASFYTSPPGSTWPSAGAGSNSTTITDNVNAVAVNEGYQIGIYANTSTGTIYVDHCDIWGFGNAILWGSTTTQQTITGNWIHDPAQPSGVTGGNYHTDYITYANGATGPNNINVNGNTLAGLGNTNVIAWQNQTGGTGFYNSIYNDFNYISGDNATVAFCRNGCVNSHFYGNTLGTDIMNSGNIDTGATIGAGTVWACNKINFAAGTTWTNLDGWTPTSAMNGQFMLDTSLSNSATDQGSNTICGIPSPSSINFGNQGVSSSSAGTTITFVNGNSGTLSSIVVSLATGTQFSVSANTCGSTLAASSSCSITVKFTPTGYGPQTDTLQIADNSSGVSSPQLVPLIGVGVAYTLPTPPNSATLFSNIQNDALVQCNANNSCAAGTPSGVGTASLATGQATPAGSGYCSSLSGGTSTLFTNTTSSGSSTGWNTLYYFHQGNSWLGQDGVTTNTVGNVTDVRWQACVYVSPSTSTIGPEWDPDFFEAHTWTTKISFACYKTTNTWNIYNQSGNLPTGGAWVDTGIPCDLNTTKANAWVFLQAYMTKNNTSRNYTYQALIEDGVPQWTPSSPPPTATFNSWAHDSGDTANTEFQLDNNSTAGSTSENISNWNMWVWQSGGTAVTNSKFMGIIR